MILLKIIEKTDTTCPSIRIFLLYFLILFLTLNLEKKNIRLLWENCRKKYSTKR